MEHISLLLSFLLLSARIENSKQGDSADFCSGSRVVDAASFSALDRRNLILYSGAYYWELDVDSKRILRSKRIKDQFPDVEEDLDAACSVSSYGEGGYMFLKGDKVWTYMGTMNPTLNVTSNLYEFASKHDIKYGPNEPGIGCAACFCHDSENCHIIMVDKGMMKKSIGCLFNYGQSLTKCQLFNKIQMPERIKDDLLSDVQECYGLTYAMDPEQPTLVVAADKDRILYFQNNELIYATSLNEVFQCYNTSKIIYFIVGGLLVFLILIIIVLILVWRIKVSNRDEASPLLREAMEVPKIQAESEKFAKKDAAKTAQKIVVKSKDQKVTAKTTAKQ